MKDFVAVIMEVWPVISVYLNTLDSDALASLALACPELTDAVASLAKFVGYEYHLFVPMSLHGGFTEPKILKVLPVIKRLRLHPMLVEQVEQVMLYVANLPTRVRQISISELRFCFNPKNTHPDCYEIPRDWVQWQKHGFGSCGCPECMRELLTHIWFESHKYCFIPYLELNASHVERLELGPHLPWMCEWLLNAPDSLQFPELTELELTASRPSSVDYTSKDRKLINFRKRGDRTTCNHKLFDRPILNTCPCPGNFPPEHPNIFDAQMVRLENILRAMIARAPRLEKIVYRSYTNTVLYRHCRFTPPGPEFSHHVRHLHERCLRSVIPDTWRLTGLPSLGFGGPHCSHEVRCTVSLREKHCGFGRECSPHGLLVAYKKRPDPG